MFATLIPPAEPIVFATETWNARTCSVFTRRCSYEHLPHVDHSYALQALWKALDRADDLIQN
jgi:hypothetical protein